MKLTKIQQLAVGLGVVVLALLLVQFVFLKGKKRSIASIQTKNEQLAKDIRVARAIEETINELREEMGHLRAQLDRLKAILPTEVNKPRFMADVKRYANENGIEIKQLSQNRPVVDDVIQEHPFTFVAGGGYHDFGMFFAQLSDYPQIVNIKGLQLDRGKDTGYTVTSSFIVSIFTYREPTEEELKAQLAEEKAAKSGAGNRPNRRGRR